MNDKRDDLEEMLRATYERRAQALEPQLDRKMSRLWRAPEHRPARRLLKPALALASLAVIFLSAWLYDLSQSSYAGPIVLDERYERPQLVLKQPGDPVILTQQIAGGQSTEPPERFVEPGPHTGVFRLEQDIEPVLVDHWGRRFLIGASGQIVKWTVENDEIKEEAVLEGLDHPISLAFDRDGNLLVLESGKGRILRMERIEGEIKAESPVLVVAEGFGRSVKTLRDRGESLKMLREEAPSQRDMERSAEPVYLAVSERGEIFVGGRLDGEAVVYKIGRKSFKWWKFYCLYQC